MQFLGIGFLVLLFLEIMSIVWVADWLGGSLAFLLMIASFALGIFMLRRTGMSGVLVAGAAMRSGKDISMYQLLWPIRFALAGLLLISPGFVSMTIALILLLPIKGKPIADMSVHTATFDPNRRQNPFAGQSAQSKDDDIIDAEYTTVTRVDPHSKAKDYIEHKPD
ncbi:FxsA family protein [Neisseria iguanae]|uniref:Membrane protein FxsA n=1 Tax=Neisseria iguanae TaxID=90242 RepID=A0A2P7TZ41_9NEIS|nr:FxsA family protein [Neisseria iguanae]PSJ79965.1 membrane protein FxsA [Neisseria iguanae]